MDMDDYHELDRRIHALEETLKSPELHDRERIQVLEGRVRELSTRLDGTIECVRDMGRIIEYAATAHREDVQPLMQQLDRVAILQLRVTGHTEEQIAYLKFLGEIGAMIKVKREAKDLGIGE